MDGVAADALAACTCRGPGDNPVVTSRADSSDRVVKRASRTVDRGMLFLPPTFSDRQGQGMTVFGCGNTGSARRRLALDRATLGGLRGVPSSQRPLRA